MVQSLDAWLRTAEEKNRQDAKNAKEDKKNVKKAS
jgi:hypothetical protein